MTFDWNKCEIGSINAVDKKSRFAENLPPLGFTFTYEHHWSLEGT